MILNPRCKLSIFGEKTWSDTDPEPYKKGCLHRFEPNALLPTTRTTITNFRLCLPNVPLNVPASTILTDTLPFPTTQASNLCSVGGGLIALRFRSWQIWREIHWRSLHLVAPSRGCSASPDELRLGRGIASATVQSPT